MLLIVNAREDPLCLGREVILIAIAINIKLLELLRVFEPIVNHIACHHATRTLCREADNLGRTALHFLEHRRNYRAIKDLGLDRFEILVRGEIDQTTVLVTFGNLVDFF